MNDVLARRHRVRAPELAFVVAAVQTIVATGLLALPLGGLLAGTPGLVGAAAALVLLGVLFGLSAVLHVVIAPLAARLWMAVTVAGLGVRLALYFLVLSAVGGLDALDGRALGLTAAAGIIIGQLFEMRALTRARTRSPVYSATAEKLEGANQ
jgi:hypothetical protein